ncbi:hypothetical protein [Pseudonocardia alni]|uniref:hypothetical protein n=1 Tax=Pseudonocardia alni TaxID=33907 RepID=UPI00279E1E52|nr:hypothetical protein PaSha_14120 [Pseudonocardia alni]
MTDQHDTAPQQLDPFTAGVQLQVVVDQLTQPTVVHLDRDLTPGTDAWQQQNDDQALVDDAWQQITTAADTRDLHALGTAADTIALARERMAAREAPPSPSVADPAAPRRRLRIREHRPRRTLHRRAPVPHRARRP